MLGAAANSQCQPTSSLGPNGEIDLFDANCPPVPLGPGIGHASELFLNDLNSKYGSAGAFDFDSVSGELWLNDENHIFFFLGGYPFTPKAGAMSKSDHPDPEMSRAIAMNSTSFKYDEGWRVFMYLQHELRHIEHQDDLDSYCETYHPQTVGDCQAELDAVIACHDAWRDKVTGENPCREHHAYAANAKELCELACGPDVSPADRADLKKAAEEEARAGQARAADCALATLFRGPLPVEPGSEADLTQVPWTCECEGGP